MNSMPKIYSLYSEASIEPRRMSAAFIRKFSSWERVIFDLDKDYSFVNMEWLGLRK